MDTLAEIVAGLELFDRFAKPDVVLGQHVIAAPAGIIGWRSGTAMAAADSFEIKLFGRGSHDSRPQSSIDPIVMAASVVLRLQTIVAREVPPDEQVVVTVGSRHSGTKENIIPDQASIKLNVRTFSPNVLSAGAGFNSPDCQCGSDRIKCTASAGVSAAQPVPDVGE